MTYFKNSSLMLIFATTLACSNSESPHSQKVVTDKMPADTLIHGIWEFDSSHVYCLYERADTLSYGVFSAGTKRDFLSVQTLNTVVRTCYKFSFPRVLPPDSIQFEDLSDTFLTPYVSLCDTFSINLKGSRLVSDKSYFIKQGEVLLKINLSQQYLRTGLDSLPIDSTVSFYHRISTFPDSLSALVWKTRPSVYSERFSDGWIR